MALVSVLYEFEYTARDGRLVSIKPNEIYSLLSRTNEHWWHVRKDPHTRPVYVPAAYMKELPSCAEDSPEALESADSESDTMGNRTSDGAVSLRQPSAPDALKETYRFSTFGFCDKPPDVKASGRHKEEWCNASKTLDNAQAHASTAGFTLLPLTAGVLQLHAVTHLVTKQPQSKVQLDKKEAPTPLDEDEDVSFPSPPSSPIYDVIPELNYPDTTFSVLPDPAALRDLQTSTPALTDEQVRIFSKFMSVSFVSHQRAVFHYVYR